MKSKRDLNEATNANKVIDNDESKVRLRRTQSVAKVENIKDGERKVRRYQPDRPIHENCDSLFSWSSGFDRFEGFVNWGALILMLGGLRLFLENVLKYGIRINPRSWAAAIFLENNEFIRIPVRTPLFLLLSNLHYLFAFFLEKLMSKNAIPNNVGVKLQVLHLIVMVLIPFVVIRIWGDAFSLLGRTAICFVYVMAFVKLWSYVQVNFWCRADMQKGKLLQRRRTKSFRDIFVSTDSTGDEVSTAGDEVTTGEEDQTFKASPMEKSLSYDPVVYPENLTLYDLYYFLAAPTLCYELNFPRSLRIRKRFLLRRLLEVFILMNILLGLFQQWIIPSVRNSFQPFAEMNYMKCLERILKLSIPNHLLWLIWFYSFFHSFLNTAAELLRFGDRNFYQDWWNAEDLGLFWRLWNRPVHNWCVRHVFVPILKNKYSKRTASAVVFLISAFFHEYVVSVPLRMYKIHVFLGMLLQVPLVSLSLYVKKHVGGRAGNLIVWASLILGQPVGIMVYYHDYVVQNFEPTALNL